MLFDFDACIIPKKETREDKGTMEHALSSQQFGEIVAQRRRHTDGEVLKDEESSALDKLKEAGYVVLKRPPIGLFKNKSLYGIDPYDPDLTTMQKLQIVEECKVNPWFFYFVLCRPGEPEVA